jgi:formylglycine-generating enzyme required for sulfatase activity
LTGRAPFEEAPLIVKLMAHQQRTPSPVSESRRDVPAELLLVLDRLLAKDPAQRYQTPAEVAQALAPFAGVAPTKAGAPTCMADKPDPTAHFQFPVEGVQPRPPARPRRRGRPIVFGAAILFVLVGSLLGVIVLRLSTSKGTQVIESAMVRRPERPLPAQPQAPPAQEGKPFDLPGEFTNSLGMRFVLVPRGRSWMGGGGGKPGDKQVIIPEDFYLGIHEVTQGQWQALMGNNPSYFSRVGDGKGQVKDIPDAELAQFPVEQVSWNDAHEFVRRLNVRETGRNSGWLYRLPREAEWEYACRGGPSSPEECSYHFYLDRPTNDLSSEQANFDGNYPDGNAPKGKYLQRPTKVGSYQPNRLGIYDLHGNVWEWCEDPFDGGSDRVDRGGSWDNRGFSCRAAYGSSYGPSNRFRSLGFRLALVPSGR